MINYTQDQVYLFVYGTFLRGMSHRVFLDTGNRAEFIAEATLAATMFDAGDYPAAILNGQSGNKIHGEIYRLEEAWTVLSTLDVIKGCNASTPAHGLFRRVSARAQNGETSWDVEVYTFNQSTENLPQIVSGSFRSWQAERKAHKIS